MDRDCQIDNIEIQYISINICIGIDNGMVHYSTLEIIIYINFWIYKYISIMVIYIYIYNNLTIPLFDIFFFKKIEAKPSFIPSS